MVRWRAFEGAGFVGLWGIEAGDEIIAPCCMAEHNAKEIVDAHNVALDETKKRMQRAADSSRDPVVARDLRSALLEGK